MGDCTLTIGRLDLTRAPYKALARTTFGEWKAITSETSSLFLDGARVSGRQTGNRSIQFGVRVTTKTYADQVRAIEALIAETDADSNVVVMTHEGGLPARYDVYRAEGGPVLDASASTSDLSQVFAITMPAEPFPGDVAESQPSGYAPETSVLITDGEQSMAGAVLRAHPAQPSWGLGGGATNRSRWWGWDVPVAVEGQAATAMNDAPAAADVTVMTGAGLVTATVTAAVRSTWRRGWSSEEFNRRGPDRSAVTLTAPTAGEVRVLAPPVAIGTVARVTAGWAIYCQGDGTSSSDFKTRGSFGTRRGPYRVQVGLQYLNGSTVIDTVWGPGRQVTEIDWAETPWAVSRRPTSATHVRPVLRWVDAKAAQTMVLVGYGVWASTDTGITTWPDEDIDDIPGTGFQPRKMHSGDSCFRLDRGHLALTLPAPVDLSPHPYLNAYLWHAHQWDHQAQLPAATGYQTTTLMRLWDATGRWSAYRLSPTKRVPGEAWAALGQLLSAPESTSQTGGVNLAAVTEVDLSLAPTQAHQSDEQDALQAFPKYYQFWVDTITAGLAPKATVSPRGGVIPVEVGGTARARAAVQVTSPVPLRNLVVATCPSGITPILPTLTQTGPDPDAAASQYPAYDGRSNYYAHRAAAPAPAAFDGVYSLLASVVPEQIAYAFTTTPQMVVRQYQAGVIVAQEIKTGHKLDTRGDYWEFGDIELPLRGYPRDRNVDVSYTFDVLPIRPSSIDRIWGDVLVLDVDHSSMILKDLPAAPAVTQVQITEPRGGPTLGYVYVGAMGDLSDALEPTQAYPYGTPMHVQAPAAQVLGYATTGAVDVVLTYRKRYKWEPHEPGDVQPDPVAGGMQ